MPRRKPEVRFDVDVDDVVKFTRLAEKSKDRLAQAWIEAGGKKLEKAMKAEAQKRFGIETTESRMQYPDPSRPTGNWAQSIRTRREGAMEGLTGPDTAYDYWVELGSQAPPAKIPSTHTASEFIGHRPVQRAVKRTRGELERLLESLYGDGLQSWASLSKGVL